MKSLTSRLFCSFCIIFFSLKAQAALSDISRIFHQTPSLNQFEVCQGGGCAQINQLSISALEWESVVQLFKIKAANSAEERLQIGQAIGLFEQIVGAKNGTLGDRAGTFDNSDYKGQLDCNDEAINTTTYMRLLKANGLMPLHEIEDTRTRNFFFTGWPHTTAVIRDVKTGERFAVDSWFYDNGHAATIVPFATWKTNYKPEDSPIGKARTSQPTNVQATKSQLINSGTVIPMAATANHGIQ
jgi:hypothetical protein